MIKAIRDRVTVEEIKEEKKGIILTVKEYVPRIFNGKVLSVGRSATELKVGDIVLVDRVGTEPVGDNLYTTRENNVLAVVEEKDDTK